MNIRLFKLLCTTFTLSANHLFGQLPNVIFNEITGDQFEKKDFTISKLPSKENVGVYHFGESEAEWDLVVTPFKDSIIIQVWYGTWAEELGFIWLNKCQTYNKVSISGSKFFFGNYSGLFVEYKGGKTIRKSVILFSDPIKGRNYIKDTAEVGFYSCDIDTFFDKERYELSLEIKPDTYFANKTIQELKILRNTIFANYGMIFQKGGEMETYFSKKVWYKPIQMDVSDYLTEIERKNLETLKRFEHR